MRFALAIEIQHDREKHGDAGAYIESTDMLFSEYR